MTIQAVIDQVDRLKTNMFPVEQKIAWINELEGKVWSEIVQEHEWMPSGPGVVLLAPDAYADVHVHYMMAKMDDANRETNEYTKHMLMFNAAWQTLCDYWGRKYMPKRVVTQFVL